MEASPPTSPKKNGTNKSSSTTSIKRFTLLVWKNYKLQMRHKIQTVTEVLLPLLFTIVLVIVRNIVPSNHITEPTIYGPLLIENYPPIILRQKWYETKKIELLWTTRMISNWIRAVELSTIFVLPIILAMKYITPRMILWLIR